ncbi:MAG: serine/threonine protein kinase [Planctomycetaceae bacterium]|nr:serine/threonine protein kinase [Planctomycetaceae bacterium]MCB9950517.1 serine/threonine protein kinase [Planctomycetaceae bacterium]
MSESPEQSQDSSSSEVEETRLVKTDGGAAAGAGTSSDIRKAGAVLGEFRLLRPLGKGGMAEVWLAEQTTLRRNVALKLLRSDLMTDKTYVARFQTEAKAAAGLNHVNIVQVYTFGCESDQHFIAQEYVDGQTLKAFLKRRGPLDLNVALHFMRQVLSALAVAGERGIVHRDIKPENIMITRRGEAKVADFGLAQLQGGERLDLTQEGVTMGTPLYMSPEQVQGRKVDQRSDQYSFGVSCYHMLAGRPPFSGDNAVSVAFKHVSETAEPLNKLRPDVPKVVCDVIARMMSRDPEDRYPDAASALNDIRRIAKALKTGEDVDISESGPIPARSGLPTTKIWLPALAVLTALLAAGLGWYVRPRIPPPNENVLGESIAAEGSAREQFVKAMLMVDNIDAFRAVEFYHKSDRQWVNRANEQLALLYLKDPRYWPDAEKQLLVLESASGDDPRFQTEARLGEAALLAYKKRYSDARRKLQQISDTERQKLSSSWRQLDADVAQLVEDGNS